MDLIPKAFVLYNQPLSQGDNMKLDQFIRDIPDFPKPGIVFKDITPLLANPLAFSSAIDSFVNYYRNGHLDIVLGIESRGFLFAAPLSDRLHKPLIPIRKKGKLPFDTHSTNYTLEYGEDSIEVHSDAIKPGQRVLIVDDLLATGGTMAAATRLAEQAGGEIAGIATLVELTALRGRQRLRGYDIFTQIKI